MKRYTRFLNQKARRTRRRPRHRIPPTNPRLDPQLKNIFKRIGVPSPTPFQPDSFQLEAVDSLQSGDVLVVAPTGSGKTWIAEEAIRSYLGQGKRSWYASPLKALSNSKYIEFSQTFGPENVGILTGDRKENPDASLVIGTTEILRNQLYDAMMEGRDIPVDLAILDEAHYLSDPDRGVVWEEVLIYLPGRVRILLLSATIGNSEEIRQWLEEMRRTKCHVVLHEKRPVPLHLLFLFPDGELTPLATHRGLLPKIRKFLNAQGSWEKPGSKVRPYFGWVIGQLRKWDLLPAIFFLKSRADCDHATERSGIRPPHRKDDSHFRHDLDELLEAYPFLRDHRQLPYLERFRLGSHHGGQLPHWKLLIEQMMNRGYLDAIFSTSTVAAGVNFPARTVVLVQSDRFDGRRFSDLTATELHQMTGRAGRRGKDRVGFALVLPGLYQDPVLVHQLIDSPPEPLKSQIQISFSMVLNLLLSHHPSHIEELLDRSLAAFQDRQSHPALKKEWKQLAPELKKVLPQGAVPEEDPFPFLKAIQHDARLWKRIRSTGASTAQGERDILLSQYLKKGRLFVDRRDRVYVAFGTFYRRKKLCCFAHQLTRPVRVKRNQIRFRRIATQSIDYLLDYRVDIPEDLSKKTLREIFASIPLDEIQPLRLIQETVGVQGETSRESGLGPPALPELGRLDTDSMAKKNKALLRRLQQLALKTDRVRYFLRTEFNRHLDFLKEIGLVDHEDRLTRDGRWASCLRLDYPLLIAEAIRKGLFDGTDPATLAGLVAPFVVDKTREVEVQVNGRREVDQLRERFTETVRGLDELQRLKRLRGFETFQIQFWPAASLFLWASGFAWEDLIRLTSVEEGDMAMLVSRTADHLRQLFDLAETHPDLARTAREAIPLVLREPVLIP